MSHADKGRKEMIGAVESYLYWLSVHLPVMPDNVLAGTFTRVGALHHYMDKAWPKQQWLEAFNDYEVGG